MRSTCPLRVVSRRLAAALAVLVVGTGHAAAQSLPADSSRARPVPADTVRTDSLHADLLPADSLLSAGAALVAAGLPRIPTADAAVGPDSVAAATVAPADGLPDPTAASPALPRVELVSTARPVVLVRGVGAARPTAPPIESARVQVDADGRRTLIYSDRPPPPPDVGAELGCGPGADRAVVRLANLSTDTLMPGDEGPLVGAAQQLLCVTGYAVPFDGRFELEMEAALFAFQSDHNATAGPDEQLVVSGTLDEQTRRVLEDRARARLAP